MVYDDLRFLENIKGAWLKPPLEGKKKGGEFFCCFQILYHPVKIKISFIICRYSSLVGAHHPQLSQMLRDPVFPIFTELWPHDEDDDTVREQRRIASDMVGGAMPFHY